MVLTEGEEGDTGCRTGISQYSEVIRLGDPGRVMSTVARL